MKAIQQLPKMYNNYLLQLIGPNGEIKQEERCTNVVCNRYYRLIPTANISLSWVCSIGTGSGEVAATDTQLFNYLDSNDLNTIATTRLSDNEVRVTLQFIIPASNEKTGLITEIGLYNESVKLITHALLKDSEGNIITINKTSVDQLLITVELNFQLGQQDGFAWSSAYSGYFMHHVSCILWESSASISNSHFLYWCTMAFNNKHGNMIQYPAHVQSLSLSSDNTTGKVTGTMLRLPASVTGPMYIHSIVLSHKQTYPKCIWYFPSELFPATKIENMSLSETPDGERTEFEPPLALFMEDTDEIYINNILQTRGVDYTIEHNNNRLRLQEVTPINFTDDIICSSGFIYNEAANFLDTIPFCHTGANYNLSEGDHITFKLKTDPQVGNKLNYWIPGLWASPDGSTIYDHILILESSNDGQSWTEVDRYPYTNRIAEYTKIRNFAENTDSYWRIKHGGATTTEVLRLHASGTLSRLGYYGQPIIFTNAPAEGDIITMSAQVDRPFKNENFIIDFGFEFQF